MNKKFRRLVSFLILLIMCFTTISIPLETFAYNPYGRLGIEVNGETLDLDVSPIIVNDRTLIPVRGVCEALGADVKWDSEKRKITISKKDQIIVLQVDNKTAFVNGKEVELDVPDPLIDRGFFYFCSLGDS
jgi:hypothetical protein